jgi:hypothetical protein
MGPLAETVRPVVDAFRTAIRRCSSVVKPFAEIFELLLEPRDYLGLVLDDLRRPLAVRVDAFRLVAKLARRTDRVARVALRYALTVIGDGAHAWEVARVDRFLTLEL